MQRKNKKWKLLKKFLTKDTEYDSINKLSLRQKTQNLDNWTAKNKKPDLENSREPFKKWNENQVKETELLVSDFWENETLFESLILAQDERWRRA